MQVTSDITKPAFKSIEHINPGDLFVTETGVHGLRGYDSYVLLGLDTFTHYKRDRGGKLPKMQVRVLERGETITLTQD